MMPKFFALNSRSSQPFCQAHGLAALFVCLVIFGLLAWPESAIPSPSLDPAVTASGSLPELRGPAAVERLKQEGSYSSLAAAMAASRYQFVWESRPLLGGIGPAYHAPNPAQGFHTYFTREGPRLAEFGPRRDNPAGRAQNPQWQLALKLKGYGYGERLTSLSLCGIETRQNRIEYTHYPAVASGSSSSAITEWYLNRPDGLEQGFTISAPPGLASDGQPLRLALEISGDLRAELSVDGQSISLRDPRSQTSLHYRNLKAWDARGQETPARMRLKGNEITLEVDDSGAVYPLTIDPLLTQQAKLTASDGAADDRFGFSVAISGDTAVVGSYLDDEGANVDQGSAYVFVRNGTSWTQQQRLIASATDGAAGDQFGISVAISGDTVVVGAYGDDTVAGQDGSAYVFVRSGMSWSQQAKLTAGAFASASDFFGYSVAISGDTIVVGAYGDDAGTTVSPIVDQGSAYVFARTGAIWSLPQRLTADNGAAGDSLGFSVAINGDTAVVGAYLDDEGANTDQGSAYVFARGATGWVQQQRLFVLDGATNDRFGSSVAISGDTAVVGVDSDDVGVNEDQGSAYFFIRSGTNWSLQQKLTASDGRALIHFGSSVAINGDTAVIGAFFGDIVLTQAEGAAYVFVRNGTNWTQQQKLTASDGALGDLFGRSVAISGATVVIGASGDDTATTPPIQGQGSAYVFIVCGDLMEQQRLADADGAESDFFGSSVAISSDTAVVGAPSDDVGSNPNQGSAFVFVRSGGIWKQQQQLTAFGNGFGQSVAISGDTIVVGAPVDDATFTNQGSAYVFARSGMNWTQQQKLFASVPAAEDQFGNSVAIDGATIVVGAWLANSGAIADQGAAYVFVYNGTSWLEQQKLTAPSPMASDFFGKSVAISGNTIAVGANGDDVNANVNQGSVFVFMRFGTVWLQQPPLIATDGAAGDFFGESVAISGNTIVVGATGDDSDMPPTIQDQGSAYVFARSGGTWGQPTKLVASDSAAFNNFGSSVAISSDTVAVGARFGDGARTDQGSVYVFVRIRTSWIPQQKLTSGNGALGDSFGESVAISGDTVVAGASRSDVGPNVDQGSAYVFACGGCPAITLNPAALPDGAAGASYNQSLTASGGAGPYRFSLSAGSLPPGLTLSQEGQISGAPVIAGNYNFTITATTDKLCTGSRSYTMVVNCVGLTVSPTTATLPASLVGVSVSRGFTAVGGTAPYTFSVTSGSLPWGLSLSTGGVVSGVPTANGVFNFAITARDVNKCVGTQNYTITINTGTIARTIRVAAASGAPGNPVAVPIELVSQGNENAVGLSLNFDPAVLSNPRPVLGSDATGATPNFNTSQAASGRLGLTLSLPSNTSFSVGTRRIFVVTFDIAAGVTALSTPIVFDDQPVRREVVTPAVALQPANYPTGSVTITPGFEADVAPRPNGDGAVTVLDWVQVGRFAAGLDTPAIGGEYQRADCAPKDSKGDGGPTVTVADWVQAGRYAAGLDPLVPTGGPTAPGPTPTPAPLAAVCRTLTGEASSSCGAAPASGESAKAPERVVSVNSALGAGVITLALEGSGDENALGFSLIFNPSQWRYVSATLGHDAAGASLQLNTNHAVKGQLGIAIALPAGQTFAAGARQLITLSFAPVAGAGQPPALAVGLADAPVEREVVAADARPLAARFAVEMSGGARALLTSVSAASFLDGDLAREQIVAAFGANLATQTAAATGLPLPTDLAGVRVVVTDSHGVARPAPLFFVSPTQINYQIPAETADGVASIAIIDSDNTVAVGVAAITPVSPALFTADASGAGPPAATLLRVDPAGNLSYEAIARFDPATNRFTLAPINLGAEGEEVFLLLYGTGIRGRSQPGAVRCALGGLAAEVTYAGEATGFVGLDQLNVKLPRALAGRGEVDIELSADGKTANQVRVSFQ